jgi:hypothetical protein
MSASALSAGGWLQLNIAEGRRVQRQHVIPRHTDAVLSNK